MPGGFLQPEQPESLQNPTPSPAPEQVQVIPRNPGAETTPPENTAEAEDLYELEERKARAEMAAETEAPTIFEETKEESPTSQVQNQVASTPAPAVEKVVHRDEVDIAVSKILEEDLVAYFQQLPPEAQARFKRKGEEVGSKIAKMVRSYKVQVKTVLGLIKDWLLTIPGVNKFFLEQEAKIKTDNILEYEEEFHQGKLN